MVWHDMFASHCSGTAPWTALQKVFDMEQLLALALVGGLLPELKLAFGFGGLVMQGRLR